MADLIGVVFQPGGFAPFAARRRLLFSNRTVGLEDIWGRPARTLRDRLREVTAPADKLTLLEADLLRRCYSARRPSGSTAPGRRVSR